MEEEVESGGGGGKSCDSYVIRTHLEWLLIERLFFSLLPPFTPSPTFTVSPSLPQSAPPLLPFSLLLTLLCLLFACSTLYVYNMLTSFFTAGREVSTLITPATGRRISEDRKGERSEVGRERKEKGVG